MFNLEYLLKSSLLEAAAPAANPLMSLLPMVLVLVFFYFFIIKPQKKREKEISNMRSELKAGDHIITIGGILGKIVKVKEDIILIEVADGTVVEILKSAVGTVADKKEAKNADIEGQI